MKKILNKSKNNLRQSRHARIRKMVIGDSNRPRLSIFRSLKSMKLQLVDDAKGVTLCYVDTKEIKDAKHDTLKGKTAQAYLAGKLLAEKAKAKKITAIVFDRGGYKYHGRVQAVADGAREGGLQF